MFAHLNISTFGTKYVSSYKEKLLSADLANV